MPAPCSTVFRQRVCHFASCGAVFYLCRHCDRGQRYCSPRCRQKSRRQQRRQANRRHQQSPEGRLDHRDRQRAYLQRRQARVTDQPSLRFFPCASMGVPLGPKPLETTPAPEFLNFGAAECPAGWVVCQICGRLGRWVNPFP